MRRFFYVGRIWGRPVPYGLQTFRGRMMETKNSGAWKKKARAQFEESIATPYSGGPLRLVTVAAWPLPKKRDTKAEGWFRTSTPDASNVLKAAEDAMNGIVYEDDRLLVRSECIKIYSPGSTGYVAVFCGDPKAVVSWRVVDLLLDEVTRSGRPISDLDLLGLHEGASLDLT